MSKTEAAKKTGAAVGKETAVIGGIVGVPGLVVWIAGSFGVEIPTEHALTMVALVLLGYRRIEALLREVF